MFLALYRSVHQVFFVSEQLLRCHLNTLEKHCPYSSDSEATALIQRTLDEQNDIKLKTKVIYDDLKKGYEDPGTDYSRTDIQGHINNIQPYIKEIELIQQTVDRDWKRYHYKTFDDRLKKCEATLANYNSTLEKHCPYSSDSEATRRIKGQLAEQNDTTQRIKEMYEKLKEGYEDLETDYTSTDIQGIELHHMLHSEQHVHSNHTRIFGWLNALAPIFTQTLLRRNLMSVKVCFALEPLLGNCT